MNYSFLKKLLAVGLIHFSFCQTENTDKTSVTTQSVLQLPTLILSTVTQSVLQPPTMIPSTAKPIADCTEVQQNHHQKYVEKLPFALKTGLPSLYIPFSIFQQVLRCNTETGWKHYSGFLLCTALFDQLNQEEGEVLFQRDIKMLLATVKHETGNLSAVIEDKATREISLLASGEVFRGDETDYYGRGPIQLTSSQNYKAFFVYLSGLKGRGLLDCSIDIAVVTNPNLVSKSFILGWLAAFWFWAVEVRRNVPRECVFKDSKEGFLSAVNVINQLDSKEKYDNRWNLYKEVSAILRYKSHKDQ